jgi:hypothetical protein
VTPPTLTVRRTLVPGPVIRRGTDRAYWGFTSPRAGEPGDRNVELRLPAPFGLCDLPEAS